MSYPSVLDEKRHREGVQRDEKILRALHRIEKLLTYLVLDKIAFNLSGDRLAEEQQVLLDLAAERHADVTG